MLKRKVLLVDDEERLLSSVSRNLKNYVELHTLSKPEEAIKYIKDDGPFAVIISDYQMPKVNGIELLQMVQKIYPDTVRIMLTGQADMNVAISAINKGSIFRFLTKPCDTENLKAQIKEGIRQYELINAEKELLKGTLRGSIKVITDILSMVNPQTFGKSNQAKDYLRKMQETLQVPNFWQLELAANMYLIGYTLLPDEIISKKDTVNTLSPAEQEMFDTFPDLSAKIISNIPRLEPIAEIISSMSYEELNSEISTETRVLRVIDDFLTLCARINPLEAVRTLERMESIYDSAIVKVLADVVAYKGEYKLQSLFVSDLKEGMILDKDVTTNEGLLLIKKGHVLNESSITRLNNYSSACGVREPVKVLIVKAR